VFLGVADVFLVGFEHGIAGGRRILLHGSIVALVQLRSESAQQLEVEPAVDIVQKRPAGGDCRAG